MLDRISLFPFPQEHIFHRFAFGVDLDDVLLVWKILDQN
jgi:hypothetical protein